MQNTTTRWVGGWAVLMLLGVGCQVAHPDPGSGLTGDAGTDAGTDGGTGPGNDAGTVAPDAGSARVCPAAADPAVTPVCDPSTTGKVQPEPACTDAGPCLTKLNVTLTDEIVAPDPSLCQPRDNALAPDPLVQWTDANGELRFACVYRPPGASPNTRRPLLVYFPGSESNVDTLYGATHLREKAPSSDLGAGPGSGFILAGIQARNMHGSNSLGDGPKFDYSYRDLATDSCNPDVRTADTLIDRLVAEGSVDPARIYVIGWSNGATFSQMYAIGRSSSPTPQGHYVASAVAYAGSDPFNATGSTSNCGIAQYPLTAVPIYSIHRSCDVVVPCDEDQIGSDGTSGQSVETWLTTLADRCDDSNAQDQLIATNGDPATACLTLDSPQCGQVIGVANHIRWPSGAPNDVDWEPQMIQFLHDHPRP